jgi:hypothetical protein
VIIVTEPLSSELLRLLAVREQQISHHLACLRIHAFTSDKSYYTHAPEFDTSASSPTTQTLSCDWPRGVLASTVLNLRKRKVGNVKRDTLSIRFERPQGPLTDLERSEFYLREGERLAHMGSWSLRADGIFDYWSPETFAIFDFDSSQGIPTLTQWLAPVQPDGRDLLTRTIDKMFREGVRGDVRYWVDHPKKGKRMMHSTGEPVLENGKVTRLIGNDVPG